MIGEQGGFGLVSLLRGLLGIITMTVNGSIGN